MLVGSNVRVRSNSDFDPCQIRVRLSRKRDLTHFFRDYGSGSVDQSGRPLAEAAHRAPYDNQLSFEVRASRIQDRPEHRLRDLCWLASSSCRLLSWISSNNRTFSMAIAAWSAKVVTNSICLSVNQA